MISHSLKLLIIKILFVLISVILVIRAFSSIIYTRYFDDPPEYMRKETAFGKLYCFEEEKDYFSIVSDYCVDDKCLYVVYGNRQTLQVYDIDGRYLRSYIYWEKYQDSYQAQLFTGNGHVYLQGDMEITYVFDKGEYSRAIEGPTWSFEHDPASERRTMEDGTKFYMRFASIYRKNPDGSSRLIVRRRIWDYFMQDMRWFIADYLLACMLFMLTKKVRREKKCIGRDM